MATLTAQATRLITIHPQACTGRGCTAGCVDKQISITLYGLHCNEHNVAMILNVSNCPDPQLSAISPQSVTLNSPPGRRKGHMTHVYLHEHYLHWQFCFFSASVAKRLRYHAAPQPASQHSICWDITTVNITAQWTEDWLPTGMQTRDGPNVRLWHSAEAEGLGRLTEQVPNVRPM